VRWITGDCGPGEGDEAEDVHWGGPSSAISRVGRCMLGYENE
jgi:hypothetical protein